MNIKLFFACCLFFCYSFPEIKAQFFSSGNEPFNVKWRIIKTEKFNLLFPSGMENEAERFAGYLTSSYIPLQYSMRSKTGKISVILHNQNVLSNGFVTWAPKRMEIVTTPSRESQSLDWLGSLALHEYRHVLQIYSLRDGFSKAMTVLIGEAGIGLPVSQTPLWLLEGDAVIAETVFSYSGRGRLPSFEMPYKACVLSREKPFSLDKFYFGSYKDFVPDYYKTGFYLTSYARLKYGINIWNTALREVGRFSFIPFSLNRTLKRNFQTGQNQLFYETIDTLKSMWNGRFTGQRLTEDNLLPVPPTLNYTSYKFIHKVNKDILIASKSGIDELNSIVEIDSNGTESVLHQPGFLYENRMSCGENLIIWDEIISDPRWKQRNYSVIKSFNRETRKVTTLTKKSRYFSPCISADDKNITAVSIDNDNNCDLVIIDAISGNERYRINSPEPGLLSSPYWYNQDTIITVFTTRDKGMILYLLNICKNEWEKLLPPSFATISSISGWKEYLIFSAGYSNTDNLYALDVKNRNLYRITSSRYGAFDPFVKDSSDLVYYSVYTENGYRPAKKRLSYNDWVPVNYVYEVNNKWVSGLTKQENSGYHLNPVVDTIFNHRPYYRFPHILNIHSWLPFYVNTNPGSLSDLIIKPGFILLSQNVLSTSSASIGLSFENGSFIFRPSLIYSGLYPVFDFSATIGGPYKKLHLPEGVIPRDTLSPYIRYLFRIYIPLSISSNKFQKLIIPEIDFEFENSFYFNQGLKKGILFLHGRLYFFRYLLLSQRDVHPKWGQFINLTFTSTPFEKGLYGVLTSGSVSLYFPGLVRHQNLVLYGGVQYREITSSKYYYPVNRISLPRGYSFAVNEPLAGTIMKFMFSYRLTLGYPDVAIGPVIYIKRIRTNLFSDNSYARKMPIITNEGSFYTSQQYHSIGAELYADLHLFRFYFPFSAGIRLSYLPQLKKLYPEFLFNLDTSVL